MANYNVGNIEIGILTNSPNTLSQIDQTIAKLQEFRKIDKELQKVFVSVNKLTNAFDKLSKLNTNTLSFRIEEISKATGDLNNKLSNIKQPTFVETAKAINRLTNSFRHLDKLKELDFTQMEQSFANVDRILTPFLSKLQTSEGALRSLAIVLQKLSTKQISRINNELNKTSKVAKGAGKSLSNAFSIGKLYFFYNYSKRMLASTYKMLTSAVDFNETLNKFQVSMGGYYQRSLEFVNDITKAFNLSTESIMDYMSTFKNMLSALGNLSEETSYELSETLTRMALDYASLFNVEVTRAMEQFQAVLSGQIRSIRSVSGYDVSETSIFAIYQQLGGTKTMRQLSQLEKRLLRIIALQQQMEATGAVGDFAKTINYTANQLKQLQETFKEIGRWIGQYFMFALQPVVEYTLSFAIAIRELLKYINVLNGYEYEDSGAGGFFGDEQSKIEGANEALEEYKTNLLGFDTLNVLGDQNATPTEDVSFLTDVIMEYQSKLTDVKNDANDIAKSMLEWLGYTYDAEGNLTTMGVKATLLKLAFEELKKSLANLLPSLKKSFKEGGATLVKIFKNLAPPIFEIISMVADTLAPILDELIPPVLSLITELADTLVPIIDELIPIIKQILNMATSFLPIIKQIINALSGVIKPIMAGILNIVQILTPFVTEIITIVSSVLEPTLKMVLPIIETILNVFNMLLPVIIMIVDEIVDYLEPVLQIIEPIFKSIFDVVDSLLPLIEVIVSLISDKWAKSLKDNTGYAKAFKEIIESMLNILTVIVETALSGIATYLDIFTGGFQTVKVLIDGMKSSMDALLKGDFKGFIKAFTEMGEQLKLIWGNVWKSIKGMFSNIINGIAQGFASFVNIFADIVNGLTSKLSGAWTWLGIPEIPEIPTWNPKPIELATGGVITQPTHALVGEYKGASSNPEIVTPENLMREVFLDSMLPVVQAIVNGNSQVVTAINNKDTNVYMNGRKVSENLYNDLENVAIRKGKTLAFSR